MDKRGSIERRSSILKSQQQASADVGEPSTTISNVVKRRVSFNVVRTVQEFDVDHTEIVLSPHDEPIKLHDTGSSDGLTSEHLSLSTQNSKTEEAAEALTEKLCSTIETFAPTTTSTPLQRSTVHHDFDGLMLKDCTGEGQHQIVVGEGDGETSDFYQNEKIQDANLNVESMDMSNSSECFPLTADATKKLFRRSVVLKPFVTSSYQQLALTDDTLASNATKLIFKTFEGNKDESDTKLLKIETSNKSVDEVPSNATDMDISSGSTGENSANLPVAFAIQQHPVAIPAETTETKTEESKRAEESVAVDGTQKSSLPINEQRMSDEGSAMQGGHENNAVLNSESDAYTAASDNAVAELSFQLDRQHISSISLSSVRKTMLGSPAVFPKKKIRLDQKNQASALENSRSSIIKSTEKVLTDIRHRLRRSLNHSGVFTLADITDIDMENAPMLYDIPVPEPLIQLCDFSASPAASFCGNLSTTREPSIAESSSLSSRQFEALITARANESSFLTNHVDVMGFEINVRTVPCLRIKPNEQPQIVELKQLATSNLQKRLVEVVERCKELVAAELPKCSNSLIAECIRTLNPRKLSSKDAKWFDVCYLIAQREWFMFRSALATLTIEKLNEMLLETKAEYERKKQLLQSVKDYQQNRNEIAQRYAQLKSFDEALDEKVENEKKYKELYKAVLAGHLEIARLKFQLIKKEGEEIQSLLKEYEKTKAERKARALKRAERRAEFLRKYDEAMAPYRDLFSGNEQTLNK